MQGEIELRSEKARNIIGKTPPSIITSGIFVTSCVIGVILVILCLFPYPRVMVMSAHVETGYSRRIYSSTSIEDVHELSTGQCVTIKIKTLQGDNDFAGIIEEITQCEDSVYVFYSVPEECLSSSLVGRPAIEAIVRISESPILSFRQINQPSIR